nr:ribonuclease H-like domain, reverse transcriptase, RNA-dependent DNA polymerase [Tanacetum cinerariifolium]
MASAIICLANNQKFNFSKYILDNLKKNLEAGVPFYMFPRFIQVFVNYQLGDMSHHKDTPIPDAPSSSQIHRKHKPRRKGKKETEVSPTEIYSKDHVPTTSNDPLPSGYRNEIFSQSKDCKAREWVEKLEEENRPITNELKSFNTRVESSTIKETIVDKEESSKYGRKIADIDDDAEVITTAKIIVDEVSTAGGELNAANKEPVSAAPTNITIAQPSQIALDEEVARRIEAEWNADLKDNIDWNEVVKQFQSRQSDVVRKYHALKIKSVSVA